MREAWVLALLAAVVLGMVTACSLPPQVNADSAAIAPTSIQAAWVTLGPNSVAIARVVTAASRCPRIDLDTQAFTMQVRAQPTLPDFPVLVCEMILPSGIASAVVDGLPLPLPKTNPQRLVVVGDTGCRLDAKEAFQACNNAQAWPFERIASTWKADFFAPAAELLRAAPWVVTRGNHEVCNRADQGWFRFLDPQLLTLGCQDYTPPYAVPIGAGQLLMLDSASAQDDTAPAAMVAFYASQFAMLREASGATAWLVTHRPIWGIGQSESGKDVPSMFQVNATLQAASANNLASFITLVLAGHLHLLEALSFATGRPPQLIVGNGGTALDAAITLPLDGMEVAGATVAEGMALARFGFMTLVRSERGWLGTVRDVEGNAMARCTISDDRITCDR
jgi:hypothetical protein